MTDEPEPRVSDITFVGDDAVAVWATVTFPSGHAERVSVPWQEGRSVRELAIAKARDQRQQRERAAGAKKAGSP